LPPEIAFLSTVVMFVYALCCAALSPSLLICGACAWHPIRISLNAKHSLGLTHIDFETHLVCRVI
jgi:hypothetical protein